jgi:Glyoxalase/Bleomycin resistance protein/Dioxygenase superfamily
VGYGSTSICSRSSRKPVTSTPIANNYDHYIGLGQALHHVCYEVDDIKRAATELARLYGAGPFLLREPRPYDEIEYEPGVDCALEHSIAFGLVLGQLVELKQVHRIAPASLAVALFQRPLNHLGYVVDDLAAECERVEARGAERVVLARSGPVALAYHRVPALGLIETMQSTPMLLGLRAALVAEAERWDGRAPLRSAG